MTPIWRTVAHRINLLLPFIPTYMHLLACSLFPIVAGSHASLSRPSSAATPPWENNEPLRDVADGEDDDDDDAPMETVRRMEGWSPSDAIVYPVLMACSLSALYLLMRWLKDPDILNSILNLYLSAFGIFSIAKLFIDIVNFGMSFFFPRTYCDQGIQWNVRQSQGLALPTKGMSSQVTVAIGRSSPLPGRLSRTDTPKAVSRYLWVIRGVAVQPAFRIRSYVQGMIEASSPIRLQDILGASLSIGVILYYNFLDKPWWLTNIFGLSFCYEALQIISPTNFYTGTLVLLALFAYDIFFVFFTPLMITVATSLDAPVKLLFPRPANDTNSSSQKQFALLGLGDVVLPGTFIGLALRFDLYLFYLKMQASRHLTVKSKLDVNVVSCDERSKGAAGKVPYQIATGNWGERFWLGSQPDARFDGGRFPKTYFNAGVMGYLFGLLCTLVMMHVFKHGQPALLYLVPAVLSAVWGTALCRGEMMRMWEYSEANEQTTNAIQNAAISCKSSPADTAVEEKTRLEPTASLVKPKNSKAGQCLAYVVIERLRLAQSKE